VARVLSTAFCVCLLAATAAAFALTEGAKTELSPIYRTGDISKVFSPTCDPRFCRSNSADVVFWLRKRQHIEVWMERDGKKVATLVAGRTYPKGEVRLSFAGVGPDGVSILPEGTYYPVIRLTHEHRTITLPNAIHLDLTPPEVVRFPHRIYTHISPDGDGRNDSVSIHYLLNSPGHGVLYVGRRQAGFTRGQKLHGTLTWNGRVDGKLQKPGRYTLSIAAQDAAGNRSKPSPFAVVTIRYIDLGRTNISVAPQHRFAVFVLTDAQDISWFFARAHGGQRSHTLELRAPRRPGTYHLYVTAAGHTAKATVTVG
jgi:hypothetical protein